MFNRMATMRNALLLCFALLAFSAAMRPCRAAAIAPKNDEEAKTQLEQALIIRGTMEVANKDAESRNLREKTAVNNALMAIRCTAPSCSQLAESKAVEDQFKADRFGNLAYLGGIAVVLLAVLGFFYSMTLRTKVARKFETKSDAQLTAVASNRRSYRPPSTTIAVVPPHRKEFLEELDQLVANIEDEE